MKRSNRNILAYAKHPNPNLDSQPQQPHTPISAHQTIYHAIIDQMDSEHSSYIDKLVCRNARQESKAKSAKTSLPHERTQSYADVMSSTPTSSKNKIEVGFSYRGDQKVTQGFGFYSNQHSPSSQKAHNENKQDIQTASSKGNKENSSQFIQCLDSYLGKLGSGGVEVLGQRKTVQRSRNSSNMKMLQRLENAEKRVKELKLSNHILESENQKLRKNEKKLKAKTKLKMQEVVDYARELTFELENQRYERKRLQEFLNDLQKKFSRHRPERRSFDLKGFKATNRIQQILLSESTEQDDLECPAFEQFQTRPKSRKNSRNKQSRLTGMTREESNGYAERHLELSEDESDIMEV